MGVFVGAMEGSVVGAMIGAVVGLYVVDIECVADSSLSSVVNVLVGISVGTCVVIPAARSRRGTYASTIRLPMIKGEASS